MEAVHPHGELRVLRGGELALLRAARGADDRQPGRRAPHRPRPRRSRRASRSWPRRSSSTSACSGSSSTTGSSSRTSATCSTPLGLGLPLPLLSLALPIGRELLHLPGDLVRRRRARGLLPPASLLDFAIYLTFFPHLVAGPIVRAREFIPQLATPREPHRRRRRRRRDADRRRADQEGGDRRLPGARGRRPGLRRPAGVLGARTSRWPPTPTPRRSTATSPATRTSRSASRCSWGSSSRRTSTGRTAR